MGITSFIDLVRIDNISATNYTTLNAVNISNSLSNCIHLQTMKLKYALRILDVHVFLLEKCRDYVFKVLF